MAYRRKLALPVARVGPLVAAHYGLRVEVVRVRDGYMSSTVHLTAGQAAYLLKVHRKGETDRQRLAFGAAVNARLRACDIPAAALIYTLEGREAAGVGENLFQLWAFVEGHPFEPGNLRQIAAAGATLGRMHRACADLEVPAGPGWQPIPDTVVAELEATWRDLKGGGRAPSELLARLEAGLGQVRPAGLNGLPECAIHGDFRAQNLLFMGDEVAAVLDLDTARPGMRLWDPAYALAFFQAVVADGPLTWEEMGALLRAYDREAGMVDAERARLGECLRLSLLRGLTLWMRIAYLERANESAAAWIEAYLPLLERVGQEVEGLV